MKLNRREFMQSQIKGAYQIYLSYAVATLESTHLSKTPVTDCQKIYISDTSEAMTILKG